LFFYAFFVLKTDERIRERWTYETLKCSTYALRLLHSHHTDSTIVTANAQDMHTSDRT